jgi:predicted RNA-binding protein with PUA-like domain
MPRRYWLLKSEPDVYSIEDLERDGTTHWDGVRNHQAKNFMRDEMQIGDRVLFYHSNAKPPGVAGVAEVVREGYPDFTAFDKEDPHYDPKSKKDSPTWFMVDVGFVERFPQVLPLDTLKAVPALEGMLVRRRGMRLSVQPVERKHFDKVVRMARKVLNG